MSKPKRHRGRRVKKKRDPRTGLYHSERLQVMLVSDYDNLPHPERSRLIPIYAARALERRPLFAGGAK